MAIMHPKKPALNRGRGLTWYLQVQSAGTRAASSISVPGDSYGSSSELLGTCCPHAAGIVPFYSPTATAAQSSTLNNKGGSHQRGASRHRDQSWILPGSGRRNNSNSKGAHDLRRPGPFWERG